MKRKCTAKTNAGRSCLAWAVHGTEPPRCPAHAGLTGGSQSADRPRRGRDFYGQQVTAQELADLGSQVPAPALDDEIAVNRIILRRLFTVLRDEEELSVRELTRIASVVFDGSRVVARLLRDERALSGEAAESLTGAIARALDELTP